MSRSPMCFPCLLGILPLLASCSGTGSVGGGGGATDASALTATSGSGPATQPFRMKSGDPLSGDHDEGKLLERFGSYSPFSTDSKGKPRGQFKVASEFDKANSQFNRAFEGKTYQAGEYKKKSWWGDRDYVKKVYGGDTDANDLAKTSRFEGSRAGEGSRVSRDSGRNFDTANYDTSASREAGSKRLDRPADAVTAQRREVFTEPDIVPYQQQKGMTMDDMKRALGR